MLLFIVDAFSDSPFCGNKAGVVILNENNPFPNIELMQSIASELNFSETAFVRKLKKTIFEIRYFTPLKEVDLCGHATIAAFSVLKNENIINYGEFIVSTISGNLNIEVKENMVWIEMPKPKIIKELNKEEYVDIYNAYGLGIEHKPNNLNTIIINSGLSDIILPVKNRLTLNSIVQDKDKVINLSKEYNVVGVHIYCLNEGCDTIAYCRNFAPLYGIDEEAATGTSNAGLTYYLFSIKKIRINDINTIVQGEKLNRSSFIYSKVINNRIYIGGNSVILFKGEII